METGFKKRDFLLAAACNELRDAISMERIARTKDDDVGAEINRLMGRRKVLMSEKSRAITAKNNAIEKLHTLIQEVRGESD